MVEAVEMVQIDGEGSRCKMVLRSKTKEIQSPQGKQENKKERVEGEKTQEEMQENPGGDVSRKRRKHNEFNPIVGLVIYVKWNSFQEAKEEIWQDKRGGTVVVKGVYTREVERGWEVVFPDIPAEGGSTKHVLDLDWIKKYGSDTKLEGKEILTQGIIIQRRQLAEQEEKKPKTEAEVKWEVETSGIFTIIQQEEDKLKNMDRYLGKDTQIPRKASIGIASLNINSLSNCENDLAAIYWLMRRRSVGITALQDTRIRECHFEYVRDRWKRLIGKEGHIVFSPGSADMAIVGGQALILDGNWSSRRVNMWFDPSKLGILLEQTFKVEAGIIRIVSVYKPVAATDPTSMQLEAQLQRWMSKEGRPETTPTEYVWTMLRARIQKPSHQTIVLGDLNEKWGNIRSWCIEMNLYNAIVKKHCSRYSGLQPTGTIDYVLSTRPGTHGGCEERQEWGNHTDHRPIWAWFELEGSKIKSIQQASEKNYRPTSRTAKEGTELIAFQEKVTKIIAGTGVADLQDTVKQIVQGHKIEEKRQKIYFWSPWYSGAHKWRIMLRKLIRGNKIQVTYNKAVEEIKKIGRDGATVLKELQTTLEYGELITMAEKEPSKKAQILQESLRKLQKLLHKRKRREKMIAQMKQITRRKQDKYLFYKTFGKKRKHLDYTQVRRGAQVLTTPSSIEKAFVDKFEEVYKEKKHYPKGLWGKIGTFEEFVTTMGAEKVPERVARRIHAATIQSAGNQEAVQEQLTKEKVTPTLAEFKTVIKEANMHSAGGPSQLTYRILQDCPTEAIEHIYRKMLEQWNKGELDQWLHRKILYPIEKKPREYTDVDNVRPIMLLEVLRKLWGKIIIRKIRAALEAARMLHRNQHGFRQNRSTATGILQLINAIEEAYLTGERLLVTSWDICAAFDSVNRELIDMALQRVGIPGWLAEFLAKIDNQDKVKIGISLNLPDGQKEFHTERGVGQGDSISPLIWVIFFDILLTALEMDQDLEYIDPDGFIYPVEDGAFADDLLSFGGSIEKIQEKADIVSGFGIIFDIQFSPGKFRAFTCNIPQKTGLALHTGNWEEVVVEFDNHKFIKYLGATLDTNGGSAEEYRGLRKLVQDAMTRYANKIDSADHHMKYGRTALQPAILYKTQYSNLGMTKIQQVEQRIRGHHKEILHLQRSFPTALLNGPWEDGGLNSPDLLIETVVRKVKEVGHVTSKRHCLAHRQAIAGLLARELRRQNRLLSADLIPLGHREGNETKWVSGITGILAETNLTLRHCPRLVVNALDTPLPPEIIRKLEPLEVRVLGDVLEIGGTGTRIISHEALTSLQLPPEGTEFLLRPLQFWFPLNDQNTLWEIKGWTPWAVRTQVWKREATKTVSKRNHEKKFCKDSRTWITLEQLLKCTIRAIIERSTLDHNSISIGRVVPSKIGIRRNVQQEPIIPYYVGKALATDGAWEQERNPFGIGQVLAAAAIVPIDSLEPSIKIDGFASQSPMRVFAQEAIAAALAIGAGGTKIYIDNKAVVDQLQSKDQTKYALINLAKSWPKKWTAQHIKAHPERRQLQTGWTAEERGNFRADEIATGRKAPTVQLTAMEASRQIHRRGTGWAIWKDTELLVDDLGKYVRQFKLTTYLQERRDKEEEDITWNPKIFKWMMGLGSPTPNQRAARTKLILRRFDRDRRFREGTLPACPCGCANILKTWISICLQENMRSKRLETLAELTRLLLPWPEIGSCLSRALHSSSGHWIWRGNPQSVFLQEIGELSGKLEETNYKLLVKALRKSFEVILNASLAFHTIATESEKDNSKENEYVKKRKKEFKGHVIPQAKKALKIHAEGKNSKITDFFSRKGESEP